MIDEAMATERTVTGEPNVTFSASW